MVPAKEVETIDTTGAGDVFCGAFSVYLSKGYSLAESAKDLRMQQQLLP